MASTEERDPTGHFGIALAPAINAGNLSPERLAETRVQPARVRLPRAPSGRGFDLCVYGATLAFLALVVGLFIELLWSSRLSLATFGFSFLWTSEWNPVTNQFGALPFIYGTVVSSTIAIILAGVVGVLAGAFLAEFCPIKLSGPLSFMIELLAAVPSVVYGLWGLFILAPVMRDYVEPFLQRYFGILPIFSGTIYGVGMLTAGVILAIMIVPTVTAISRDVMAAIPQTQREAIWALGATRWQSFQMVVLPGARAGVFGACILALGRALGETIATTMVIGNRPAIAISLFAPGYSISSVIANEFTEATTQVYLSALIELGLLLFIISVIVNAVARVLLWTIFRPLES
ncbi:MAG TPA: phosphate ABC transporter permease subunit PstC [Candidatus Binataceae bacterium]|nr:phosphate ABC transporter permease subunit PstC [Candidatus Binataceae bacterium]